MPAPSFWFDIALWATDTPASPISAMSSSLTHTECAIVVFLPRMPRSFI